MANGMWVEVIYAASRPGTEAFGRSSSSLLLCLGNLGAMYEVKSLIFQGLFVAASKPSLALLDAEAPGVWDFESEGARKESVKVSLPYLDPSPPPHRVNVRMK